MSDLTVKIITKHTCDETAQRLGWEDRWMEEWRGTTSETRDSLGRISRGGSKWQVWRCSLEIECPAKAVVRADRLRILVSAGIEAGDV